MWLRCIGGAHAPGFRALACIALALPLLVRAAPTTIGVGNVTHQTSSGPTTALFPIARTGDTSFDAVLGFHTVDGAAVAGSDYTATTGNFVLARDATTGALPIDVAGNITDYSSEDFGIVIDGATGVGPPAGFFQDRFDLTALVGGPAVADFLFDGRQDLIFGGSNVTFTGAVGAPYAAGTQFSLPQPIAFGTGVRKVRAADFNGDGRPDVAGVEFEGSNFYVMLNTTDRTIVQQRPTFSAPQSFTTTGTAQEFVLADINNDGRPDAVVAGANLSVLLNTTAPGAATSTFAAQQTFGTGGVDVAATDFNGDGRIDLVTSGGSPSLAVRLNTTAIGAAIASFAAPQTFAAVNSFRVEVVDMNSDGRPDLCGYGVAGISVLLNATATGAALPAFAAARDFTAAGGESFLAADVNLDGKPDLVYGSLDLPATNVRINRTIPGASIVALGPEQSFQAPDDGEIFYLDVMDANGDGRPDVVRNFLSSAPGAARFGLLPSAFDFIGGTTNAVSFAAQQPVTMGNAPTGVALADIDGDGRADLLSADSSDDSVSVRSNATPPGASSVAFAPRLSFATGDGNRFVVADFNADGRPDLVVTNGFSGIAVRLNDGLPGASPSFSTSGSFATGGPPAAVAAADFNGDGRRDIVVAKGNNASVGVLFNTTALGAAIPTFAAVQTFATGTAPTAVATADLDLDGRVDVIALNFSDGTASVLRNTTVPGAATPGFAAQLVVPSVAGAPNFTMADISGDGRPDIIVANRNGSAVAVIRNTTPVQPTAISFAAPVSFPAGIAPEAVIASDLNGDGKTDLALTGGGATAVLVNVGNPNVAPPPAFAAPVLFNAGIGPVALAAGDANGDGINDLVVANIGGAGVSVILDSRLRVDVADGTGTATLLHGRIFSDGFE